MFSGQSLRPIKTFIIKQKENIYFLAQGSRPTKSSPVCIRSTVLVLPLGPQDSWVDRNRKGCYSGGTPKEGHKGWGGKSGRISGDPTHRYGCSLGR